MKAALYAAAASALTALDSQLMHDGGGQAGIWFTPTQSVSCAESTRAKWRCAIAQDLAPPPSRNHHARRARDACRFHDVESKWRVLVQAAPTRRSSITRS